MSKHAKILEKLIPSYVPNSVVLFFFTCIAFFTGPVKQKIRELHFEENQRLLSAEGNGILKSKDLIENQSDWGMVQFGSHRKSNISYSGCEIIATYNALRTLGDSCTPMPFLIKYYEQKGIALKGGFGITPRAAYVFFKERGYEVKKTTSRNSDVINRLGDEYKAFIITFYWNKDNIKEQLHTVCISKERDGFYIHNNYCRRSDGSFTRQGGYTCLAEAVSKTGKNTVPLVIIGIRRRMEDYENY